MNFENLLLLLSIPKSNSDVTLNDRLPIQEETHEDNECKRRCVPHPAKRKMALSRMIRRTQVVQSQISGYFEGYISKRQKVGKMETKKLVDKMYTLREKHSGSSEQKQQRAVSSRMITDIEMNGTVRGAVEVYNLAKNIRPNDCLFAECIRTFATVDVDARAWLHRLEVELQNLREVAFVTYVPPSIRPHVRSNNCKPEYADMYGFTPKLHAYSRQNKKPLRKAVVFVADSTVHSLSSQPQFVRSWSHSLSLIIEQSHSQSLHSFTRMRIVVVSESE